MMYTVNGKPIRIPDEEIRANMKLGISKEEAIQMWLEDNEYELNDEQVALDEKAKNYKVIHEAKTLEELEGTKSRSRQKDDPEKENLINEIVNFLNGLPDAENIIIQNKSKIVTFSIGDNNYKIDLIRSRK